MSKFLPAAMLLAGLIAAQSSPGPALQPPASTASAQGASNLFVVIYRPGPSWQQGRPMSEQGLLPHGRYYRGLLNDGRLFAGGGFTGSDGGMAILKVADMDAARAIVAADPAVTSGIFVAQLEQWRPRFQVTEPLPTPPQAAAGSR
jgi:uncharacterized protein YciI